MPKAKEYIPLRKKERDYICQLVHQLAKTARDEEHSMHLIARKQMADALWRWTADGINAETGVVKQDAFKYDTEYLPSSKEACLLREDGKKGLRHEHVVPRMVLVERIIERDLGALGIRRLLNKSCFAVVLTKEEDGSLWPPQKMPDDWKWGSDDVFARYPTGLGRQLRPQLAAFRRKRKHK